MVPATALVRSGGSVMPADLTLSRGGLVVPFAVDELEVEIALRGSEEHRA